MNINGAYPSTYIKASDLQSRTVRVQISVINIEEVGDGQKPVIYFTGKEKGLVLNKTNANTISTVLGTETDAWIGKTIELYPTMVDFQGRQVEAIRVRMPRAQPVAAKPAPAPEPPPPPPPHDEFIDGDSIPF